VKQEILQIQQEITRRLAEDHRLTTTILAKQASPTPPGRAQVGGQPATSVLVDQLQEIPPTFKTQLHTGLPFVIIKSSPIAATHSDLSPTTYGQMHCGLGLRTDPTTSPFMGDDGRLGNDGGGDDVLQERQMSKAFGSIHREQSHSHHLEDNDQSIVPGVNAGVLDGLSTFTNEQYLQRANEISPSSSIFGPQDSQRGTGHSQAGTASFGSNKNNKAGKQNSSTIGNKGLNNKSASQDPQSF
jgi:hypothetical protein